MSLPPKTVSLGKGNVVLRGKVSFLKQASSQNRDRVTVILMQKFKSEVPSEKKLKKGSDVNVKLFVIDVDKA